MHSLAPHRRAGSTSTPHGTLHVVSTPIGNLGDLSSRALDTLRRAHVVACEDTRVSAKLLSAKGVHGNVQNIAQSVGMENVGGKLLSCHEHNEAERARLITAHLHAGRDVALVCDAGTPAISDPGAHTVAVAHKLGFKVSPVPGPNAAIAALAASGFSAPGTAFAFFGFLPADDAVQRIAMLTRVCQLARASPVTTAQHGMHGLTCIMYEAPHRIVRTLGELEHMVVPHARICIARELTKLHESVHVYGSATAAREALNKEERTPDGIRGEFVILLEGQRAPPAPSEAGGIADAVELLHSLLLSHARLRPSEAVRIVSDVSGVSRKQLYSALANAKIAAAPDRRTGSAQPVDAGHSR